MTVLVLESSTSSAKAMLMSPEQGIMQSEQCEYPPDCGRDGKLDVEKVFNLTVSLGKKAAQGREINAVALCGIWHSIAAFDRLMNPVSPLYMWNCLDTAKICADIRRDEDLSERIYRSTGCPPHCTYPRHVLQLLAEQGMNLKGKKFMTQGAYMFYKLTGEWRESVSTQSGGGFIRLASRDYDPFILELLGISAEQMAPLGDYRDVRPLTAKGSALLGIPAGIPVVPAHPDGAMNQIGSYASGTGIMTLSVGTSAAMRLTIKNPKLSEKQGLWCYCGADDWILGAATAGACSCINWFCQHMAPEKSYDELEEGDVHEKNLPVFLPFLFGERCPGWEDERTGGFCRLKSSHSLQELYTAIQRGVIFNLYQCYEILVQTEQVPEKIIVSGGIVNSARWVRMLADIFGRKILISDFPNASSVGAGVLGLCACGALKEPGEFKAGMEKLKEVNPDPSAAEFYAAEYQTYLKYYDAVKW